MTRCATLFRLLVLVSAGLSPAGVSQAADARHGGDLARRWCANCHVVSKDQTSGNPDLPSFAAIAQRPGFSAAAVSNFLRDPHPKMPDMALTRTETDDIAAYIASLR